MTYEVVQGTVSTLSADLSLASPGQDFTAVTNGFVDIPGAVTSASIAVVIVNDLLPEIDEVFLVRLTSVSLIGSTDSVAPPRLATAGTVSEVRIGANDGAQGVVVFASDSRRCVCWGFGGWGVWCGVWVGRVGVGGWVWEVEGGCAVVCCVVLSVCVCVCCWCVCVCVCVCVCLCFCMCTCVCVCTCKYLSVHRCFACKAKHHSDSGLH